MTRDEQMAEIQTKLQRVNGFLRQNKLDGLLLTKVNNFAWLTAGLGDNHILLTDPVGVASLLVMADGSQYVVASNTEIGHIREEELAGLGYQPAVYNWYDAADAKEKAVRQITGTRAIGTDTDFAEFKNVEGAFNHLRYELTESELKRYRWVCRQSAEAVATVCRAIKPGMTDREIEAMTINECKRRGLMPTVVLIGLDERLYRYYHYPPVGKTLRKHAFVNICAKRWGLTSSVGRYVYFGNAPDSVRKQMRISADICARMQDATKPGTTAKQVFDRCKRAYAEHGQPDGWQPIHVGGAIGYAEREWVASDQLDETIQPRMAFAWNPFTRAALSFDTVWLRPDGTLENLTTLPGWPTVSVTVGQRIYAMPDLLIRSEASSGSARQTTNRK